VNPTNPPLLEVHELASGDVSPTSAFVHLVLKCDRFFSGNAAFEKAEELRRLAGALSARGISQGALSLEGVSLDVSSGVFTKSSSVTYRVRILLEDVDLLTGVLEAVAETKKASLGNVEWNYDDDLREEHALIREAGARVTAKARALAESVGATLGPLRSIREERIDRAAARQEPVPLEQAFAMRRRAGSLAEELGGLELSPKKRLTIRVSVAYALAE
jgi:uncharacterized protein YggE